MRHPRSLLPIVIALAMLTPLPTASAAVDWTHELTDAADDVENIMDPGTNLSDQGRVDILSGSVAEEGDDINVTLTLSDRWDEDAIYELRIVCDGDEARTYTFWYSNVFTIEGYQLMEDDPRTHVSPDGRCISWLIEKERISATAGVEVTYVSASVGEVFSRYVDTAPDEGNGGGGNGGGGGGGGPVHMRVSIEMVEVTHVRQVAEIVTEGSDARAFRVELDVDADGTVSAGEVDQAMDRLLLENSYWNSTTLKLDGTAPGRRAMTLSFQGVLGSIDSTGPVVRVVTLDVHFPEAASADGHTYTGDLAYGDRETDMWDVTSDSEYTLVAPAGWVFETSSWPSGMVTYMDDRANTVSMSGTQMHEEWNATMGSLPSVNVVRADGGDEDGGDDSPAFGALAVGLAIMVVMAVATIARRG